MSPKFINGSFAALFDHVDIVAEYARHITRSRTDDLNGCPIRMSPRRRLDDRRRQYSLDHSFHLQPATAATTRQRFLHSPEARQGSLDSKIEEIFQAPVEEDDEYEESGGKTIEPIMGQRVMGQWSLVKWVIKHCALGHESRWSCVNCSVGRQVKGHRSYRSSKLSVYLVMGNFGYGQLLNGSLGKWVKDQGSWVKWVIRIQCIPGHGSRWS